MIVIEGIGAPDDCKCPFGAAYSHLPIRSRSVADRDRCLSFLILRGPVGRCAVPCKVEAPADAATRGFGPGTAAGLRPGRRHARAGPAPGALPALPGPAGPAGDRPPPAREGR